jgi:hypothetical protein
MNQDAPTLLHEHEPFSKTQSSSEAKTGYSPTEDDQKLIKKCDALLAKAKKARSRYDYPWVDYYKMFRGRQWKEQRPSYRSAEVFNLVWQAIQSQVPIIMDIRPKFEYLPQEPSDREFADLMNDVCSADWHSKNWLFTMSEVLYDSHILGTGLSSLKYDPTKENLIYHSIDPFYMFPDPSAESFHYRCSYTHHAEPWDIEKVKRLFPDKAQHIKTDVVNFPSERRIDLSQMGAITPSTEFLYVETIGGYENTLPPEVLVKTIYMEDSEVLEEEIKEIGEDGAEIVKLQKKLKYPNGRKVVYASSCVLQDGENEYEGDDIFPYQRLVNYISPRSFWGISEVEPLESPQRVFNKLVSYVLDVLFLMGNPIWIVDTTSGIDTQNLTNQPGLVVEKEPGSEVQRESGVQLQPYVLSLIDRMKELTEQLSGSQDITRGIAPGSVTAASAIADLQNAAQTRMRLKMKNLDAYLQDFGQQYASRVMQFYTAPKVYRLTGKDGTEKYFKMHVEKLNAGYQAVVQRFTDNALLNPTTETYQLRGKLDVRVTTGSSLPFSKAQNEQRAYALFDRGIIDSEEVLKTMEYPNWEAIQQRMQAQAQQKMMADQAAAEQAAMAKAQQKQAVA